MKIKTQMSISVIVFFILAVAIIFSYFSSENQLQEIQKKQQIIDNIEKSSFELYYLENDYILHGGTRTVERWKTKYDDLTGQFKKLTLTDPTQQAVLNSMLDSHADLQTTFFDLVAVTGSAQGGGSFSSSLSVKEFAASTLTGHTQMMLSRASELSQLVKDENLKVEQRTSLIISFSIAVLMIFVLLNYLIINRSVLRSISALEKGTERIGSGDLDTKIETGSNDEMGDLSVAITEMAAHLKTVLTSKSNLEKEVAERKRAEEALHQANKKLKLLSSITRHDINNQMTVLMGYIALLEMKQPDPTLNEYFGKVSNAAQRISSMIHFTKEYEAIGVNAPLWQDCHTLINTATKDAPLGQITVKNDLPVGTEVFADPLIAKVFYNLMENAVRYGGKITSIHFSADERDDDYIVVCEDDGVGISDEDKKKLFTRGFGKNTGLGLFLSREILAITGITIIENGTPGKGARFEITVPKGGWRTKGDGA